MLCDVLEKYHSFPAFTLLLGSLFQYRDSKELDSYIAIFSGIIASSYLVCQKEGHILQDIGFPRVEIYSPHSYSWIRGTRQFFVYFTELLENPKRSGTHTFDQRRFATAAKECLQLCLCNHHSFSKGARKFVPHDNAVRRNHPWAWIQRLGVQSRIRKGRQNLKVQQHKSLFKDDIVVDQHSSFPENSLKEEYCRSLIYKWLLDMLPFLLEKSGISLELAKVLCGCTFTTMAQKFPQKRRLAKDAIKMYLLRVEGAVDDL